MITSGTNWLVLLLAAIFGVASAQDTGSPPDRIPGAEPGAEPAADTAHVTIRGSRFHPRHLHIAPGTVVVWTNADPLVHTASDRDGDWGSPGLLAGDRFAHKFDDLGEFPYLCLPHPHMTGVVRVEAVGKRITAKS
jgi:plastocyanin